MIKERVGEAMGEWGKKYEKMSVSVLSKYLRDSSIIVNMREWPMGGGGKC